MFAKIVEALQGDLDKRGLKEIQSIFFPTFAKPHELSYRITVTAEYPIGTVTPMAQLVPSLHFPELDAWREVCSANNLDRPPPLLGGLDAVSGAVAEEQTLLPQLARHRVLSLSRAPVTTRLELVRLLAKHDTENAV